MEQVYSIFSFKYDAVVLSESCLLISTKLCVCRNNLLGEMFKIKKKILFYVVSNKNKTKFDLENPVFKNL